MALIGRYQHWLHSPIVSRRAGFCLHLATSAASASFQAAGGTAPSTASVVTSTTASDLLAWRPSKGVTIEQSLQVKDYFQVDRLVSKRQLMEHRVHLGHKSGCRSEWMAPHLFGCRCGVDIIDLEQAAPMMRLALNFTAHVAARGGIVLFFWQGWPAVAPLIERRVREMAEFAYTRPWVDQALTDAGNYFDTATRLPDLAIFLSCMSPTMLPHPAIAACAKVMIPTVGICDSNADPRLVTYPVPGNDDSPQAIRLYLALFAEAIRRGKTAFAEWSAPPNEAVASQPLPASAAPASDGFKRVQLQTLRDSPRADGVEGESRGIRPQQQQPSDQSLQPPQQQRPESRHGQQRLPQRPYPKADR